MRENGVLPHPLMRSTFSPLEDPLSHVANRPSSRSVRPQRPTALLRTLGAITLVAVAVAGCASGGVRSASASRDPDAKDWIELFNRKNLDGWTAKIAKHEPG